MTWLGHGSVLLETAQRRLLVDPVLGRRAGLLRRLVPPPPRDAAAGIDAVLLTHLHADHADLPSLRLVGMEVPILASPGAEGWLRRHGLHSVRELRPGECADVDGLTVRATPAQHEGRRWPGGRPVEAVGFVVESARPVYVAGDTDLFPEMQSLAGHVVAALLPISGWGSSLGPGHMDPDRAAKATATIRPRVAIPIHWGTLGLPWTRPDARERARPAREFAARARAAAPGVQVRVLAPGDRTSLE